MLVHVEAVVFVLLLLDLARRAAVAGTCGAWVVQDERVAQAVLLEADTIALWEGAAVVHHLLVVLRQGVVLQLLQLVTGRHVSELLAAMVIQYST